MTDFAALDNPIWLAVTTVHEPLARVNGLARRYAADVSPLAALRAPTAEAFADMSALAGPQETIALFTTEPVAVPGDWQIMRERWIEQMICTELAEPAPAPVPLLRLRASDVAEMLALTAATEPGPFRAGTIDMGRYFGIRSEDGGLAAMAGERLQLREFTEVSAVCTDPRFRGRGYAGALVAFLAGQTLKAGKTPFLHVNPENSAKNLYERIGFRSRRDIRLTVIARR